MLDQKVGHFSYRQKAVKFKLRADFVIYHKMREYRFRLKPSAPSLKRDTSKLEFPFSLRRISESSRFTAEALSPLLLLFIPLFPSCYTETMQPNDQDPYRQPSVESTQANGPVVTLSAEEDQAVETVYPADGKNASIQDTDIEPIRWQATEYIHREKDQVWFIIFFLVTVGLIAVAIFIIKSPTFAILVPVMAAALFIYTRRPPRMLDYTLSRHGLHINDQLFSFGEFKSFALMHGMEQYSIMLIPTKRFKPAITINFPEEAGEAIVDTLAARLPMREVQPDMVDRIIKKLHL